MPDVSGNHRVTREKFGFIYQKLESYTLNPGIPVQGIYYRNNHIHLQISFFAALFIINNQKTYILIKKGMDKLVFRTLKLWNKKSFF